MAVRYLHASMWEAGADVLVNPVNCVGVMGRGIAKVFRDTFPSMFDAYQKACKRKALTAGCVGWWHLHSSSVANLPTKRHWKDPSRADDIELGLYTLATSALFGDRTVAMPKIGCGAGGLNWRDDVEPLVAAILGNDFDIVVCTGKMYPLRFEIEPEGAWEISNGAG